MRPDDLLKGTEPVRLEDQAIFEKYFTAYPQNICEMSFRTMLLWGESREHRWMEHDGHLLTSFKKTGEDRKWYPPVGPDPASIIRKLPPADGFTWFYVDEPTAKKLEGELPVQEERPRFDYIYSLPDLRSLAGKAYAEKRTHINKCRKLNPEIVILNGSHKGECEAMLDRWMKGEHAGMSSAKDEISSLRIAMENYDRLGFVGCGIRINGQMEAFAIGSELNSTMFLEHFEKSSNAYPGLYQIVFHEFAKAVPEKYTELNKEEDLGLPGLRTAKERWNPLYLVKKYSVGPVS